MLVAAKCTQCGANIEVESTLDAGICPNCGTGLFGVKKLSNVPDNDAKALTKQSVDFAYKEFLNGKFKD